MGAADAVVRAGVGATAALVDAKMNRMALSWVLFVASIVMAHAEPLAPPRHDRDPYRDLAPPAIACPDQQTIDEVEAMRRLGDREGEAITRRSFGCEPILRPRPGPFER